MRIPVIFYHALFGKKASDEKYAVRMDEFRRQMEFLAKNGFKGLLLQDLYKPFDVKSGRKKILITFDDGNASDFSIAYPILKEYGFPATFFVTAGWVGKPGYVTWQNLEALSAGGMSIQSHSLTHSFMSDLSPEDLRKELEESKAILSKRLKRPVEFISLPGGFCSKRVLDMARELKYKGVCTSRPGVRNQNFQENGFAVLDRLLITRKTTPEEFRAIVYGDKKQLAFYKAEYYFKRGMRKILGSQGYYKVWSRFFKKA